MIAHKNHDCIFPLPRCIQMIQKPTKLIVHQLNHGIIGCLHHFIIACSRPFGLRLKIYPCSDQALLRLQIGLFKMRPGKCFWIISTIILIRRIKWRVGVKWIDTHQPRLPVVAILIDKFNRLFRTPMGLMQLRRKIIPRHCGHLDAPKSRLFGPLQISCHIGRCRHDLIGLCALCSQPLRIIMAITTGSFVIVTVLKIPIAIVAPWLLAICCR